VHLLTVVRRDSAGHDHVVLRRYVQEDVVAEEPDIARREGRVLRFVENLGLPTPILLGVDPTGAASGSPALLMSRVPGKVEWSPPDLDLWLTRLAALLPSIHGARLPDPGELRAYVPYSQRSYEPPGWARLPSVWARAVEIFLGPRPPDADVFVHRDFHPGNVLWHRSQVTGVVDWQSAATGPPSVDVGHCRSNLLRYGPDVADRFTRAWESLTGSRYHPWADVVTIVGCLDELRACRPRDCATVEAFLARAVAELGASPS
jgi:aminoglycoside phosphotransferase (APT) family kinase protein